MGLIEAEGCLPIYLSEVEEGLPLLQTLIAMAELPSSPVDQVSTTTWSNISHGRSEEYVGKAKAGRLYCPRSLFHHRLNGRR
jgi:hypothetical protein